MHIVRKVIARISESDRGNNSDTPQHLSFMHEYTYVCVTVTVTVTDNLFKQELQKSPRPGFPLRVPTITPTCFVQIHIYKSQDKNNMNINLNAGMGSGQT